MQARHSLYGALLILAAVAVADGASAQIRDPRCAGVAVATVEDAKSMQQIFSDALAKFEADFGPSGFDDPSVIPPGKSVGEVWATYLDDAGFPKDLMARQCMAVDFAALGLPQELLEELVMATANKALIGSLIEGLTKL